MFDDCNCKQCQHNRQIEQMFVLTGKPDGSSSIEMLSKGWECPRCGLVNAPSVNSCPCSKMRFVVNVYRANGVVESDMPKESESTIVNNNEVIGQSIVLGGAKENER